MLPRRVLPSFANTARCFPRRSMQTTAPRHAAEAKKNQIQVKRPRPRPSGGLQTLEDAKRWADMTAGEKVVHATKQTSYVGITLFGLGLTGAIAYAVVSELFGSSQATAIYNRALDVVQMDDKVAEWLGAPIKGFREHRRGGHWKRFDVFEQNGKRTAFMRFGVSGEVGEGTVNAWLEDVNGKWEFTHVNVETPGRGYPSRRVVVIEQRQAETSEV